MYGPNLSHNTALPQLSAYSREQSICIYGFQSTRAHLVDFDTIQLEPDEKQEDLHQRLVAFVEDNLLQLDRNISNHGERVTEDEYIYSKMENCIVLTWLLINPPRSSDTPKTNIWNRTAVAYSGFH